MLQALQSKVRLRKADLETSRVVMVWAEQIMMIPRLERGLPPAHTAFRRGSSDRAAMDMSRMSVWFEMSIWVMSL